MKKMTYEEYCERFDSLIAEKKLHDSMALFSNIAMAIMLVVFALVTNTVTFIVVGCCVSSYIYHASKVSDLEVDIRRLDITFYEMYSSED